MDVLRRLSIAKKIYLIPVIGTLSFVIYLILASMTALNNVKTLEQTRDIQFPVLQASQHAQVLLERVKDSLASAVTTGDSEAEGSVSVRDPRAGPGRGGRINIEQASARS